MRLIATELRLDRATKVRVSKVDRNKKEICFFVGKFVEHTDFDKAAKYLSVDPTDINAIVAAYNASPNRTAELSLFGAAPEKPKYLVRGERADLSTGKHYDILLDALQDATAEQVIEWDGAYWSCCLDVDFDDDCKPSVRQLENFAECVQPSPFAFNISRNGGVHLFYEAIDIYSAEELAAVAAYHWLRRFPQASFEFLCRARAPGDNELFTRKSSIDIGIIKSLLLDGCDTDNAAYLEAHSLKPGTRLDHTECPVNPSIRAKKNSAPVIVYEDHFFCYICERDGRRCGSKQAGYFPFSALDGGRVLSQIHDCVMNFTHWGHAQYVFTSRIPDLQLARRVYSALLKLKHGEDPRIPIVFTAGEPNGLVRYAGHWRDYTGTEVSLDASSPILASLPRTMTLSKNMGVIRDPVALEWLSKPIDLKPNGYAPITPIRGIQFTQYQNLPEDKVFSVLRSTEMVNAPDKKQPKYIPDSERLPEKERWAELEQIFPGIDKRLVILMLVARGCTEHHSGMTPMLFLTGPTGAGKTGHVEVAAAICGDSANMAKSNRDSDRFDNKLYKAKSKGAFVFLDEFFKFSKQSGQTEVEAMETLLAFTPSYLVYMIHIGSIPLGDLPCFIWADTEIPSSVQLHEQIGRRVHHYPLYSELKWTASLSAHGIEKPSRLRLNGSDRVIQACNSILSQVIDDYFTGPVTDFAEVCKILQVATIRDGSTIEDKRDNIRHLFNLVCKAPPITDDSDKRRFSKEGFKIAKNDGICPIYQAFMSCQSETEYESTRCAAIGETDLANSVLGMAEPLKFECKKHGNKFAVRFVSVDGKRTNDKILKKALQNPSN